jgi:hypothetical protein
MCPFITGHQKNDPYKEENKLLHAQYYIIQLMSERAVENKSNH